MGAETGSGRARRGRAGTHRRSGQALIRRRDHVPPRTRRRPLPAPSPSALVGIAVLVLIAVGVVHLSSAGTAVPLGTAPTLSQDGATATEAASVNGAGGDSTASPSGGAPADGAPADGADGPPADGRQSPQAVPGSAHPARIVVHVSGAVAAPGVVDLPSDARVASAIEAAGGATSEADLSAVNLARPLVDGEQIHVPVPGEQPRPPTPQSTGGGESAAAGAGESGADGGSSDGQGPIDLNTASAAQLEELPGVGPSIAARIIEHREKNGPFTSVDDLLEVSGIGPATLEKIRGRATV